MKKLLVIGGVALVAFGGGMLWQRDQWTSVKLGNTSLLLNTLDGKTYTLDGKPYGDPVQAEIDAEKERASREHFRSLLPKN